MVGLRIENMRGVDLSLFQFDYDVTLALFFLSPDGKTIYARYGARHPGADASSTFSATGLRAVMTRVLEVHARAADHAAELAGKRGPKPPWPSVDQIPIVKRVRPVGCLHCHNVYDGHRMELLRKPKVVPRLRWPYPPPANLGLGFDPADPCKVATVAEGSAAAKAGLKAGDVVTHVAGQLVLSIADIGWALHRAPDQGVLAVRYRRGDASAEASVALASGWRESDLGWRSDVLEWREVLELPATDDE